MIKYKILITDPLAEEGYDILKKDPEVYFDLKPNISKYEIKKIIGDYDAIITRSRTSVPAEFLENTGKLKIIGRAAVGVDNIDIEAASKKNLLVINAPAANTISAAELTMGMMLAAARKIPAADSSTRSGEWERKKLMGIQLQDKVLGIVGMGRIGTNVAIRAKAFGMRLIVYDPYIKKSKIDAVGAKRCDTMDELLKESDIVTLHAPLTIETKNIINKISIDKMKEGAILINCARGGLVNSYALSEAVKSGKLFSAAVDVFEEEPPKKDNPLLNTPNIFITPHIGANTEEGQIGMAVIACEQVLNALHNRPCEYVVNMPCKRSELPLNLQSFFDLAEKLGSLAAQLTTERVRELSIIMAGKVFEEELETRAFDAPFNFQSITTALIKSFLEILLQKTVSFISAPYIANNKGIKVNEAVVDKCDNMDNHVILKLKTDNAETAYAGTVLGDNTAKITKIGSFDIDLSIEGSYLFFKGRDESSFIDRVFKLLDDYGVSIINLKLARKEHMVLSFVEIDRSKTKLVEELLKCSGIIEARIIKL